MSPKKSISKDNRDTTQVATSSSSLTTMFNSNESLIYNLSYLSSVIHPVIILRLLEHRLFTPLFKKKSITKNPTSLKNLLPTNENKKPVSATTTNKGTTALTAIPTLPMSELSKRQRNSSMKENISSTANDRSSLLTKFTQSTYDKHRKVLKSGTTNTSLPGIMSVNSQLPANIYPSITSATPFSLPMTTSTTNNSNPSSTTRKWFWKSSDKNAQSNMISERNPLLQSIVETDGLTSTTNVTGVGEIRLLEKELLNLPSFQLSESQNPLLPSPTCLNYDFPTQFDQTNSNTDTPINRQQTSLNIDERQLNGLCKFENK